eukprot:CAMPEP_0201874126 /NCGR_PEP_ID=MMETSP0902-20130614/6470_1 /ASSEMBLY_ACC=CAM_ASM_000551 /TAXON_ID=420261 /ORGANISM="Thalassiosira antarctica, Strain CCMP982" /LENGTH=81 /DNA_ID=CAMNT_0048400923 /DNA_START=386 /DNA_END=631 /DNA_ORIENTATION=-
MAWDGRTTRVILPRISMPTCGQMGVEFLEYDDGCVNDRSDWMLIVQLSLLSSFSAEDATSSLWVVAHNVPRREAYNWPWRM